MFEINTVTAFPTDTSWGLAVRADDTKGLKNLAQLKNRKEGQMFSLIVRDFKMLQEYAEVPEDFPRNFFIEKPRTVILKPTEKLPKSEFWPEKSVAFRITTIPDVAVEIDFPVTATSANFSGEPSIFSAQKIKDQFGNAVLVFPDFEELPEQSASEMWDFTLSPPQILRK